MYINGINNVVNYSGGVDAFSSWMVLLSSFLGKPSVLIEAPTAGIPTNGAPECRDAPAFIVSSRVPVTEAAERWDSPSHGLLLPSDAPKPPFICPGG